MPTKINYQTTHLPPTEMWVEGRNAYGYEKIGWSIVDYEPPPEWCLGCYSGRAKVREPGNGCDHVWSPELCALHKLFCSTWDNSHPPYSKRNAWNTFGNAHTYLMNDGQYHEVVMLANKSECLEDVQKRLVDAILGLIEKFPNIEKYIKEIANKIYTWKYS